MLEIRNAALQRPAGQATSRQATCYLYRIYMLGRLDVHYFLQRGEGRNSTECARKITVQISVVGSRNGT